MPQSLEIPVSPASRAESTRTFPYAVAVLLLPVLVLWHRDDPLFSPLWQTDPWFYLGYFRNLVNFKRDLFPDFYYGSRLSWILPGYVLHALFSPVVANAILHLAAHSVAVLSLFFIVRWTIGIRTAYLTAMTFSLHPWLWAATGWDHVNGGAIAYFLLAMALLTRAAVHGRTINLILAGMAVAGSVYAHFFLIAFAPLLLIFYLGLTTNWQFRPALHRALKLAGWMSLGFVVFTAPISVINAKFVDGNPWFWSPSFKTAQTVVQNYTWNESIWSDQKLVPWLWFVVAGTAVALFLLLSYFKTRTDRTSRASLLFSIQLLLAAGLMASLQGRGITLLGHYYYACYLLPFVFLVLGASLWPSIEKMSQRTALLTCVLATLLFGALWYEPSANLIPLSRVPALWQILLAGAALAGALLLRWRPFGIFLGIIGLAILTALVYTGSYGGVDLHATRLQYQRVMNARQDIEMHRRGAPILFWYDKREMPAYFEYYALNATYMAEFARINENFPSDCSGPAQPGTVVVVTSQKPHAAELAQAALTACWRNSGLQPALESQEIIRAEPAPYTLTMLKVEAAVSTAPPGELFKSIPLEQVQLGYPQARLRRTPEGLEVQTIRGLGAFAGRVPLGLNPDLREKLVVFVRLRVIDGKVSLGILDKQNKTFLVSTPVWALPQATDVIVPLPSPSLAGDLIISNVRPNKAPSKALVEKIEIRKIP